jgi:TPR repeat protein
MTFIDPSRQPPIDPNGQPTIGARVLFTMCAAILVAIAVGGLLQEARWRGAFSSMAPSPLASRDQQLKLGEVAFRNGNDAVALNLFEGLAAKNDAAAQYWLAHMSELGIGVPKDIPKALSLYQKAAALGSVPAQTRLGELYLHGNLATPDYVKAFDLLGKAARSGDPRAAMLLGQMYRFGLGTSADPIESFAWSEVAVVEGLSFARVEREAAFSSMSPADREKGATRSRALLEDIKKQLATSKTP